MNAPVIVMNTAQKRDSGRKAQMSNIQAAKAVADIIRSTLGPRSRLKMILDPMGGLVITNDGNAILREIDVSHPAAKSMIELSRTQDEEVGDGTTSVIVLSGEMLVVAAPFIERSMHPTVIVRAYYLALEHIMDVMKTFARDVDPMDRKWMNTLLNSCIGTKFVSRYGSLVCDLALKAVTTVARLEGTRKEIDIKRFARVEKIPGGELTDCCVLDGVMFDKDVTHSTMRRRIENPRILLLDCTLEYKKSESSANFEITNEEDWTKLLKQEEDAIKIMCDDIIRHKPDVVITEKGLSDLAQHFLVKAGITALRRLRKTDNNRIARATGATIVHRTDEIEDHDIGTGAGLFEVRKVGDRYFTYIEKCRDPKACTILLRGASKDGLNEMERNLQDAMLVARNLMLEPKVVPGGGAVEMALAASLTAKAAEVEGVEQWPFRAVAKALEVMPRTIASNCGADVVRLITELRSKHASGEASTWGVDGEKGVLADMEELGVWDTYSVKMQTIKTAVESAAMLLRIDDIVSGLSRKK